MFSIEGSRTAQKSQIGKNTQRLCVCGCVWQTLQVSKKDPWSVAQFFMKGCFPTASESLPPLKASTCNCKLGFPPCNYKLLAWTQTFFFEQFPKEVFELKRKARKGFIRQTFQVSKKRSLDLKQLIPGSILYERMLPNSLRKPTPFEGLSGSKWLYYCEPTHPKKKIRVVIINLPIYIHTYYI